MKEQAYPDISPAALHLRRQLASRNSVPEQEIVSSAADIAELKNLGYKIEEREPGLILAGLPDTLYEWELADGLTTTHLGKSLRSFASLGSTNQYAFDWAGAGAPHGATVVSDQQLSGRGRFDRQWVSPAGKGLYFSLILRPDLPLQQAPLLTLLTAVAVAEAAREIPGVEAAIKWPNDVLCAGSKICGILAESKADKRGRLEFVVIGIGVNVNLDIEDFPPEATAVSLKLLHGAELSRTRFLQRFLIIMENCYTGFVDRRFVYLKEQWQRCNCTLGHDIAVNTNDGAVVTGLALDISEQGGLVVRLADGTLQEFLAGDVSIGSHSFR
jgi:BirA family biotin operon repressor/biotin-[acetyl-CoA-carboxylase] ligase